MFKLYFWNGPEEEWEEDATEEDWKKALTEIPSGVTIKDLDEDSSMEVEVTGEETSTMEKATLIQDISDEETSSQYLGLDLASQSSTSFTITLTQQEAGTLVLVPAMETESEETWFDLFDLNWEKSEEDIEVDDSLVIEDQEDTITVEDPDITVEEPEDTADSESEDITVDQENPDGSDTEDASNIEDKIEETTDDKESETPADEQVPEEDAEDVPVKQEDPDQEQPEDTQEEETEPVEEEPVDETEETPAEDTDIDMEENAEENAELFMETAEGVEDLDPEQFATARLVVLADNADVIVDPEHVIGTYDNIYLLQYEVVEQAMNAYIYYSQHALAVEPDMAIEAASEEDTSTVTGTEPTDVTDVTVTETENPVAILSEEPESTPALNESKVIALIDTGVSESPNVIDRVSLIDDSLDSPNSHGNEMVTAIVSQNPDAKILSIKAMDADGKGTVSSIVSAIEYAINQQVSIINLSMYAKTNLLNTVLESEIQKAVNAGIEVVGAAGNDGADVVDYMPGSVNAAWIIGAANEDGTRYETSNYGDTVDYNVVADSTSEAAAKFSGYLSLYGTDSIVVNEGVIYATDYVPEDIEIDEGNNVEVIKPERPPEYEEDSPAYDEEEIWQIDDYPEFDSVVKKTEYVWVKDTDYDFTAYNPYGDAVTAECTTEIGDVSYVEGSTVEASYKFTLVSNTEYYWKADITFEFIGDRDLTSVGSDLLDRIMPEYVNQSRNEGYDGIVPSMTGEIVEGRTYNVLVNTENFELGGLVLDYNPHTFKVNHIDEGDFDITKPGSYTVIHEVSHFMYYDYTWFVKSTVNVVDPAELAPGLYLTSNESTLMFYRNSDNYYGGYGDLLTLDAANADFTLTCIDDTFDAAVTSSSDSVNPDDICTITDAGDGKKNLSIAIPEEPLTEAVILSLSRPGYEEAKLFTGGGWQTETLTEEELSQLSETEFAQYEDELSGESDTDQYMYLASSWSTVKTTNISGHLISGSATGTNYGWSYYFPGSNYGTVYASSYATQIANWCDSNGFVIEKSKIKNFNVSCISGSSYMGMKVNTRYSCTINCSLQKNGSSYRLCMSVTFRPASDSNGNYQTFAGSYYAGVENNAVLRIRKMFRNSTIAEATGRVESLKTVFGIFSNSGCTTRVTTLALSNDEPGGYKTSGTVEVPPGKYWVKEIYRIKGCAQNNEVYGPVVLNAGDRVDLGTYFKDSTKWENLENEWVYNRPYYYRGKLLTKVDEGTEGPVEGAVYRIQYSEYEDDNKGNKFKALYTWYFKTDENGEIIYDDDHLLTTWDGKTSSDLIRRRDDAAALPLGYLRIKEVEAPEGYSLDNTTYKVEIKGINIDDYPAKVTPELTIKEQTTGEKWLVRVNLKKVTASKEGLEGAVFKVYLDEQCTEEAVSDYLVSGADGMSDTLTIEVPVDQETVTLYCKELEAPDGYILTDEVFSLTFEKSKYDELYEAGDTLGELKTFGPETGIVNEEGTATPTPSPKPEEPTGAGVYVKKTSTAAEEILGLDSYGLGGATFSVTSSKGFSGTLTTDETGISNQLSLPDDSWWEYFDPVYDKDGNYLYTPDPVLHPVTTTYYVRETKAPDGHLMNGQTKSFTVTMPYDKDKTVCIEFEDEPYFCKNALNVEKLGVKGEPIEGAVFKVEFFDASSAVSSKLKKTWYLESDANGMVKMDEAHVSKRLGFKSDPFFMHKGKIVIPIDGYLQLTEVAAPAEYVIDEEPFGFQTGETVQFTKRFYNDLQPCTIRMKKYGSDGTTPLPGVEFELKFLEESITATANKNPYFNRLLEEGESIIRSTNDVGELSFENLDQGKYQITEVKTAPGQTLLKEPIIVTIPMQMTDEEANEYGNVDYSNAKLDDSYSDNWFFYNCLYEVTNTINFVVPTTGGMGTWKLGLIGAGVIAVLGVGLVGYELIIQKRRKRPKK